MVKSDIFDVVGGNSVKAIIVLTFIIVFTILLLSSMEEGMKSEPAKATIQGGINTLSIVFAGALLVFSVVGLIGIIRWFEDIFP